MAKMNWGRVAKERLLWEHKGGGGRVETETQRLKRKRKRDSGRRKRADAGKRNELAASAATASASQRRRQPRRHVFADGTTSWQEHNTRKAVERLARSGRDAKGISRTLGISEAVAKRHLEAAVARRRLP